MSGIFPLLLPHTSHLLEFLIAFHFYFFFISLAVEESRGEEKKKKVFSLKAGVLFPEFLGEM